jgi:hypothetical protein
MCATVTVSLGLVRERAAAKNRPTQTEDASQPDISEPLVKDSIAHLAHALWERRGCPHGSAEEDWREAERQLHQSSEHVLR